ncbi:hypothetical protein H2200_002180 [Cladophialophora chaetospira]|uniref:Uncharacterized protein n=1 Tax=Cladophialophora chaetospira TaxID=386627 RepID=A0AA38XIH6_9EURO|nr:hypothetical protein H2200_002180 [Cladophialophora chaetospira]
MRPPEKRKGKQEILFLVHTKGSKPTRTVGGVEKALINAHIAKHSHEKRRAGTRVAPVASISSAEESSDETTSLQRRQQSPDNALYGTLLTSALRRGNSDPFTTTVIPVTSMVHECLVFTRDCYLPSLHGKEIDLAGTTIYMDAFWQDAVDGLQDECIGYAYLARSAAILTTINANPETENLAVHFRTLAMNTLRQRLARMQHDEARLAICWAVYSLFSAEIAAHNWSAAEVHGRYLRQIIQPRNGRALKIEPRFMQAVMYQDIQRASLSLSRPSFDLARWLTDYLPRTWQLEGGLMGTLPVLKVDASTPSIALRSILIDIKEWIAVLGMYLAQPSFLNPFNISHGSTRGLILEAELIDLYLDTMDVIGGAECVAGNLSAYHNAAAALAALTWRRRVGNHENMGIGSKLSLTGTNVYNAGPLIAERLEDLLRASEEASRESRLNGSDTWRVRLWCFYVGAVVEQSIPGIDPSRRFHNRGFANLAGYCGLHTWDTVQPVLEGFLYFEGVGPTAQMWFERLTRNVAAPSPAVEPSKELVVHRLSYIHSFAEVAEMRRRSARNSPETDGSTS